MSEFSAKAKPTLIFCGSIAILSLIACQIIPQEDNSAKPDLTEMRTKPIELMPVEVVPDEVIPDFSAIADVNLKKQTFFDFLQRFIDDNNSSIIKQREVLKDILLTLKAGAKLNQGEKEFLANISTEYKLSSNQALTVKFINQLLKRVDIIPSSLVLSQAANESAWGTSRFARAGNNYFGQWCFEAGCGIVPAQRGANKTHEVKRFASVAESVHAYFMNLNTFASYQPLRLMRQQLRSDEKPIDGISLSAGLTQYSSRGSDYIDELKSMIYGNNLLERDKG